MPRLAFEGGDVETLRGLVGAGLGVSLLPPSAHPTAGVVELHVTAPRTTRTIGLVWMRDRPITPPVRALLESRPRPRSVTGLTARNARKATSMSSHGRNVAFLAFGGAGTVTVGVRWGRGAA